MNGAKHMGDVRKLAIIKVAKPLFAENGFIKRTELIFS